MTELIFGTVTPENKDLIGSYIEALSTIGSAMVALFVGLTTLYFHKQGQKKQHTVDIMLQLVRNRHLSHAALMLDEYANDHTHLKAFKHTNSGSFSLEHLIKDEVNDQFYDLFMLLGFYEFIAQACLTGTISESVVKNQRKSRIISTWIILGPMIQERRHQMGKPGLYEHIEKLATKFATPEQRTQFAQKFKA